MSDTGGINLQCAACGAIPPEHDPFQCPDRMQDQRQDHLVTRYINVDTPPLTALSPSPHPYIRFRTYFASYHLARRHGISDETYVAWVQELDEAVKQVDRGFSTTPFLPDESLSAALGLGSNNQIWIKDESGNVGGSHKARHLFGVLLYLAVLERAGLCEPRSQPLAIASCGNAALAAAVLAKAAQWPLDVYIPVWADPGVKSALKTLGANLVTCPRPPGMQGDPCYHRFMIALKEGAIPFSCQGPINGLAVEGGMTLGYELLETLATWEKPLDRLFLQVGGGAFASACIQALNEGVDSGLIPFLPRIHPVQTVGCYPLSRAYHGVLKSLRSEDELETVMAAARQEKAAFMHPWESPPESVATGILDDETYDWATIVQGTLQSEGKPVVVTEDQLLAAQRIAQESGYGVCPTGTSGFAGLLALQSANEIGPGERMAVIFTGADR